MKNLREILDELWNKATLRHTFTKDEIDQAISQIESLLPSEEHINEIICDNFCENPKENYYGLAKSIADDVRKALFGGDYENKT